MSELQKPLRDSDVHLISFTVDPLRAAHWKFCMVTRSDCTPKRVAGIF